MYLFSSQVYNRSIWSPCFQNVLFQSLNFKNRAIESFNLTNLVPQFQKIFLYIKGGIKENFQVPNLPLTFLRISIFTLIITPLRCVYMSHSFFSIQTLHDTSFMKQRQLKRNLSCKRYKKTHIYNFFHLQSSNFAIYLVSLILKPPFYPTSLKTEEILISGSPIKMEEQQKETSQSKHFGCG